jgi:hypothetical protein
MNLDISDLLSLPYHDPGTAEHDAGLAHDCWSLAREVLARMGFDLPECCSGVVSDPSSWARVLSPGEGPAVSDVVEMAGPEGARHIGVLISGGSECRVIHAARASGVRTDRLSTLVRAGCVVRIYRPARGGPKQQSSR